MNKVKLIISSLLILLSIHSTAQMKELKAGHVFYISVPEYMDKTYGLNDDATIQFKNVVKDVYGFVIEDTKETLAMVDMKFGSANEFYEHFIKDFLKDEDKRTVGTPKSSSKNGINFVETDVSYYDKDAKGDIYYFVGIVETKDAFYKVLCFTSLENKDKVKADFQKILYSLKD